MCAPVCVCMCVWGGRICLHYSAHLRDVARGGRTQMNNNPIQELPNMGGCKLLSQWCAPNADGVSRCAIDVSRRDANKCGLVRLPDDVSTLVELTNLNVRGAWRAARGSGGGAAMEERITLWAAAATAARLRRTLRPRRCAETSSRRCPTFRRSRSWGCVQVISRDSLPRVCVGGGAGAHCSLASR